MSTLANKTLLLQINEAIAAGRLGELEQHPDLRETRHVIPLMHMLFADWQLGPVVQLAEGPLVCSYGTLSACHNGQFAGVPATGRRITVEVISIDRVENGLIMAHNSASTWWDALPVLGARGFDDWPTRSLEPPLRPPTNTGRRPAPGLMHELLAALCAGDWSTAEGHNVDDVVEQFRVLRAAFSGLSYAPVAEVTEGDMSGTRGALSGTHTGELYGLAPTGKAVSWEWFSLARVSNDAIVEQRSIPDWNAALRQLGIFVVPTEAPQLQGVG